MTIKTNYDDYKKVVGELFILKDHELNVRLTEVGRKKVSGLWESFSLVFKAEGDFGLEQGTFLLKNDVLGEMDIFLVPIGGSADDASLRLYESVFNRQIDSAE
jgi:hypothetical protein